MQLENILKEALDKGASDIFILVGQPVLYKINGNIEKSDGEILYAQQTEQLIEAVYTAANNRPSLHREAGDDDFALSIKNIGRFRVNVFRQRGTWSVVMRVVAFDLAPVESMNIPDSVLEIAKLKKGLVLITGTAGSGKSTTLTYIIDAINRERNCHILTLEDPIEYLHRHKKSVVSQREIGIDTPAYAKALRAAMREAPDVILIGEMRDLETMEIAMTAAETGHLVLSTLHTLGAANTVDRVIDVFPPSQQQQIRIQLSMILRIIVSQQLLPTKTGKVVPAFEIMQASSAVKNMIREGKVHQLDSVILSSAKEGMKSMDNSILELYRGGVIDAETAMVYSINQDVMRRNVTY